MADDHDLPSDSDESDEDYVPGNAGSEAGSENESEGEPESEGENEDEENSKTRKRRSKGGKKGSKKKRKVEQKVQEEIEETEEEVKKEVNKEEEKKKADSLWADFLKDTGTMSGKKNRKITLRAKFYDEYVSSKTCCDLRVWKGVVHLIIYKGILVFVKWSFFLKYQSFFINLIEDNMCYRYNFNYLK